ncbi:hypothetical protein B0A55_03064 [Lecanosticta acicola]|uniref:Metalloendopeptidase n=1 Tax=Lecanosticta acicola TaxID=111012 RepID=A0AAI8Z1J5_9PEZI|nr:hypothetical protein B0A55_03064 [Lecanosticta acicola]
MFSAHLLPSMLLAIPGILSLVTALPAPLEASHNLSKRWYGVVQAPADPKSGTGVYTWPVTERDPIRGNLAPIWYCFEDVYSAKTLTPIVRQAIQKWRPALSPNSAVVIGLHPECRGNGTRICKSLKHGDDALVISDERKPEGSPLSTTDYNYKDQEAGRHYIRFRGIGGDQTENELVRSMAHELGHVIGLAHEHQREGRDRAGLVVHSKSMADYYQAKTKVIDDKAAPEFAHITNDANGDRKMALVLQNPDLAKEYSIGEAINFMKGSQIGGEYLGFQEGGPFDWQSIMLYSSWQGAASLPNSAAPSSASSEGNEEDAIDEEPSHPSISRAVIVREGADGREHAIFQGGSYDASLAKPSRGDVQRVIALYPKRQNKS